MASKRITRSLVLVVLSALALARGVRADDLDILSRTVPPDVVIMLDSSGSMSNIILPDEYLTARGTMTNGNPANWFNKPTNDTTNAPASYVWPSTSYYYSGSTSSEDYRPNCQIFGSTSTASSATTRSKSLCYPGSATNSGTCTNDDSDSSNELGGSVTIRCWNLPGGCTYVPTTGGMTCSTNNRGRYKNSTATSSQPYTIITMPNVSYVGSASATYYPVNYLWWFIQQIYLGKTPVPFIGQDRNGAAKQAVTNLVNAINVDGQPPRVKFALARYDHTDSGASFGNTNDNGGYILVPADLNNKTTLLANVATIPANGSTPLSETLVDIGRYLAGGDLMGTYPRYSRDLTGTTVASQATVPQTPLSSSCEKVFVILVTDGLPTNDSNNHYGTAFSTTFGTYADGDGQTLDDVAAYLYATDLRKTLSGDQNVITYTVGFTVQSTLLQHTADRGHGTYFQSNNATDLADSLISAIQDIIARNTTLSSATVPSTRTAFGNGFYTAYFTPTGRKSVWPGKLEAYTLSPSLVVLDDNNNPAIDPVTNLFLEPRHPHWEIGATLLADYASRTIYTTKAGARVPFLASKLFDPTDPNSAAPNLSTDDLGLVAADVNLYPQPATSPTVTDPNAPAGSLQRLGQSIMNWVTGFDAFDEDADGSTTNARPFVFGDVFHSSPVAVGPPLPFLRFETGYGPSTDPNSFMGIYAHRDRVLYVGANDGMLHGVNAGSFVDPNTTVAGDEYYTPGTGHEVFAYVPGFELNKIKMLPRNDIAKQYYVDGPPAAADVWIDYNTNGAKDPNDWTTVLLTPVRQGGEGMLALDVTNPAATSGSHSPYPRLMWEFTNADLGQTWSRPIITRVKMKGTLGTGDKCGADDGDGDCVEQWVAIFGAGYEDIANPNMTVFANDPNTAGYNKKGRGIFIVRISDGSVLAHVTQDTTSTTSMLSNMKYAIAAEPAVLDLNNDGFADVIYIGDAGGQMWKWDVSAIGSLTSGTVPTSVWPIGVVFRAPVATVAGGLLHYHSIFEGAAAAYMGGQLWISFGSGERQDLGYMGQPDPTDPNSVIGLYDDNNRFWAMKDPNPTGPSAFPSNLPVLEAPPSIVGHDSLTDITDTASDGDPTDAGYFFRVPDGVKFITDSLIFQGIVATLAYMPDLAGSGTNNDCALGGTTIEYAWELANGAGVLVGSTSSGGGSSGTPSRSQPLGNGAPTNPRITISRDENGAIIVDPMVQTSTGEVQHLQGLPGGFDPVDMIFWRQDF